MLLFAFAKSWLLYFSSLPPRGGDYSGGAGSEDFFDGLLGHRQELVIVVVVLVLALKFARQLTLIR